MQISAPSLPVLFKAAMLIAVSSLSGVYMGWSAIGQIDPFYYTPRINGSRYAADPVDQGMRYGQPADVQPYHVDYPYAPAPSPVEYIEMAASADAMPDPIDDVSAYSNLRMASVPDTELGGCMDCDGPYEPGEPSAEPSPVAGEIMTNAPEAVDASASDQLEVY